MNFRHNKGEIGILPLMVRLLIDAYRTAEKFPPKNGVTPKLPSEVAQCL